MKKIEDKDRVDDKTLQTYEEMNLDDIIRETLLCKGEQVVTDDGCIRKSCLEDTALWLYGLKSNATNKLYVGLNIDRMCQRTGLCHEKTDKLVRVPMDIYNEAKAINDSYRKNYKETFKR